MKTPKIITEWLTWFRAQPKLYTLGPIALVLILWILLAVLA